MKNPTGWLVTFVCLFLGGYDLFIFNYMGNDYTISRVFLNRQTVHPLFGVEFVWGLGVFCGHLFIPTLQPQTLSTKTIIFRVLSVLVPVFQVLIELLMNTQVEDAVVRGVYSHGVVGLIVELNVTFLIALIVGHKGLPQHV